MSFDNNLEGYNIVHSMWYQFWNPHKKTFTAQWEVNGTIGQEYKFNSWSVSMALHAIVDATRVYPDYAGPLIEPAFRAMMKYKSHIYGGFCAFEDYENNSDIYYDDDAQVASAILCAYEVTGNKEYFKEGRDLVHFLMKGWLDENTPGSKTGGGMKWHMKKNYINTCTTSECAIAAMRLSKLLPADYPNLKQEQEQLYKYAKKCIDWVFDKMVDPHDNIPMDGSDWDSEKVNPVKWTYNTGNTLSGCCRLYEYDQNPIWAERAKKLAEAATDRGRTLFDRDYSNWGKRFWHDPNYFVQLLVEGLADYIITFSKVAPESTKNCCINELERHLSYMRKYLFDKSDGLYYMHFDIYKINRDIYQLYKNDFKGHKDYNPWHEDRQGGMNSVEIDKRPMRKCLIGSAAAARIFLQAGRVVPKMDPPKVSFDD